MSLEIYDYMVFRGDLEKQPFDMPIGLFHTLLKDFGLRTFFGCTTDGEGKVLSDTQNPEALKKWRSPRAAPAPAA